MIFLQCLIDSKESEIKVSKMEHGAVSLSEKEHAEWIITAIEKAIEHVNKKILVRKADKIAENKRNRRAK